ncbi:hypothetical protein HU200_027247 [Digitaria exilis]|uniref:nicotinate phosphoribosyltransferase n=1 Tax=Digitaria exilis TaxID=1010633 RepID=A0A835BVQ7_9POAL|nr:hypothetical protein HU200_027247 [Digitaria exilis]
MPMLRVLGFAANQPFSYPYGAFFDYLREVDCSDVEVYSIPEGSVVFPKVPLMRVEGPVAGPDGAISASKYCFMGGFDATSNVLAGNLFGIPLRGTHSHAFVSSYMSLDEIPDKVLRSKDGSRVCQDFVADSLGHTSTRHLGHEVDAYGIGTYLVTCYSQAALGCVFKLVEINSKPRIKLSEDVAKVSIPCKKRCFRLYGKEGYPLVDIMIRESEPSPKAGERILCRHPFIESKRAYVVPQHVEELLQCYWPGRSDLLYHVDISPALKRSAEEINPSMCSWNFLKQNRIHP